jgi:hypothetical protein
MQKINFETMDTEQKDTLRDYLRRKTNATDRQLDKFMHTGSDAEV